MNAQQDLNIGNSIFKGFNDQEGIFLCGYEWGFSKNDQDKDKKGELEKIDIQKTTTSFSNKINVLNKKYPYDERIIKWFSLWGHPLQRNNNDFEKCIIQTNWCNTQNYDMNKVNIYDKLLNNKENFLTHIEKLKPKIIFFLGSEMIKVLNNEEVKPKFENICGRETKSLKLTQKDFQGIKFKIGFQSFEECEIISLPHPSGSKGLQDKYIELFKNEISPILNDYKKYKNL